MFTGPGYPWRHVTHPHPYWRARQVLPTPLGFSNGHCCRPVWGLDRHRIPRRYDGSHIPLRLTATHLIFPGQVVLHSVSTPESHTFDMKRSLRTVALEPNFSKSSTRALVCGGMAGSLVLHEKGWLGYRETVLHTGEGPIWEVRWRGKLIAWANDMVRSVSLVCLLSLTSDLGGQNIRYRLPDAHHLHRPSTRQSSRRPLQMYLTLAG